MFKKVTSVLLSAAAIAAFATVSTGTASATSYGEDACIDGKNRTNFTAQWDGYGKVTVTTKDGKAICEDATVYFSAFVMPDTWDGKGFNDTAVPQTLHKSVSATIKAKKTNSSTKLELTLPEDCKNVQVDVYLAPEQTEVTKDNQIGGRLIAAKHKKAVGECQTTPPVVEEPETPVEEPEVLGETTVTPEVTPEEAPATLPETGIAPVGLIAAAITAAGAYAAVYRSRK